MKHTYYNIVKYSPKGDEAIMEASVMMLSEMIEDMAHTNPEVAERFKRHQYELLNGRHFNEAFARDEVAKMHHGDKKGEMVSLEAVKARHTDPLTMYDAYVGYNAILHDLAGLGMDAETLMKAAEHFWFMDDDFSPRNEKVWWYFSNKD